MVVLVRMAQGRRGERNDNESSLDRDRVVKFVSCTDSRRLEKKTLYKP